MAGPLNVAASVGGLVSLSIQLGQNAYMYTSDAAHVPRSRRRYLQEALALSQVLVRLEDALYESQAAIPPIGRPLGLSYDVLSTCKQSLLCQNLKLQHREGLEAHLRCLDWPFQERELKKVTEELHRFRELFAGLLTTDTSTPTSNTLAYVQASDQDIAKDRLLKDLYVPRIAIKMPTKALAGTGLWLLDHVVFKDWKTEEPSTLYCYGPPGAGKTYLASIAAEHLSSQGHGYVLRFFADFSRRKQQTEVHIMQVLLQQLAEQAEGDLLKTLTHACGSLNDQPSAFEVFSILTESCRGQDVFVIFDALDEVQQIKPIISRLLALKDVGCHILVTSSGDSSTSPSFLSERTLEIRANETDLVAYIQDRFAMSGFGNMVGPEHPLFQAVISRSNGLFLLARLLIDSLMELPTLREMRNASNSLPTHLHQAYETSLQRIDMQSSARRQLAYRTIAWILYTEEPLSPAELIHALATKPDNDEFDHENVTTLALILRSCAGFVTVDDYHGTLVVVHKSAYEFLENTNALEAQQAHEDIARTCLTYLQSRSLRSGACETLIGMRERLGHHQFLSYAARHWGLHTAFETVSRRLSGLIRSLLDHDALLAASFQALHFKSSIMDNELASAAFDIIPTGQTRLHVAAYWGLAHITSELLAEGDSIDSVDSRSWTSLHWAAFKGHVSTMETLLQNSCPLNAQDEQGWTAAIRASFQGNVDALKLLADAGADLSLKDLQGWHALRWAVAACHGPVVKLLQNEIVTQIRCGATDGASMHQIQTLASAKELPDMEPTAECATGLTDQRIFDDVLLASDSKSSYRGYLWSKAHLDAPVTNFWKLVNQAEWMSKMVFGIAPSLSFLRGENSLPNCSQGAVSITGSSNDNQEATRDTHETLLKSALVRVAIRDERLSIVKLLLETGALPNDPGSKGSRPALHVAAFRRDPSYVRALTRFGASVSAQDQYGQTPLQQAAVNGFPDTVEALLEAGSDPNAKRSRSRLRPIGPINKHRHGRGRAYSMTALALACGYVEKDERLHSDQGRILDMLVTHGMDLHARDSREQTLLHHAASCGQIGLARNALSAGIDVNAADEDGATALHRAVFGSGIDVIDLLITNGADVEMRDKNGRHAIHYLEFRSVYNDTSDTAVAIYQMLCPVPSQEVLQFEFKSETSSYNFPVFQTLLSITLKQEYWDLATILLHHGAAFPAYGEGFRYRTRGLAFAIRDCQTNVVRLLAAKDMFETVQQKTCWFSHEIRWRVKDLFENLHADDKLERFEELLAILSQVVNFKDKEFAILPLQAAESCKSRTIPGIFRRSGFDLFRTNESSKWSTRDPAINALLMENLQFLQGLMEACSTCIPNDHWLKKFPMDKFRDDQPQVLDAACAALAAAGKLDMKFYKDGTTILSGAIQQGKPQVAAALIEHGADIHLADFIGWQPLHWAALHNDKQTLTCLLSQDTVNADARVHEWLRQDPPRPSGLYAGDEWHGTALHIACILGRVEAVKCLLEHGSSPNASAIPDASATPEFEGKVFWWRRHAYPLSITLTTDERYGLLEELCAQRLEIARLLLDHGADASKSVELDWPNVWQNFVGFEDVWDRLRAVDKEGVVGRFPSWRLNSDTV